MDQSFLNSSLGHWDTKRIGSIVYEPDVSPLTKQPNTDYNLQTYIVIGCLHAPYHHKKFVDNIIQYKKDHNIKKLVIAGDFLDLTGLASYAKGSVIPKTVTTEYDEGNKLLDAFGEIDEGYFIYGNHEERFNRYMKTHDASKLGEGFINSPEKALKLEERGFIVNNDYMDGFVTLGDLEIIHGVFYNKHVAQKHLDVMKKNVMFVHTHRIQTFSESGITAYNIGWCGNPDAKVFKYRTRIQRNNWRNGFAVVNVVNGKAFVNQIYGNQNGQFFAEGKFYS